ncbi:MAG: RNB domain-containing ribonuclease [Rhodoglobus sp.]
MPTASLRLTSAPATGELATALAAIPVDLGIVRDFAPEVIAEAQEAIRTIELPDADHTDLAFVTIDPAGSKDLDQALYLERDGTGYRAWYAIADVPAVVRPGGALDAESRQRGQTVYAPDGRIPLYPTILSEGAASLLPDQLRGAYVWDSHLDADARVSSVSVARARVRSREQLDYDGAQKSIDDGSASENLALLKEIGLKRILLEQERGGASLQTPETEIEEAHGGYELVRRQPLPVENWNAQLSLMTGMAAADLMLKGNVGILRTMPPPDDQAVDKFRMQAKVLGHPWPKDIEYGEYLRGLDTTDPFQLAIMHAAGSLFRGAGYTAFDGAPPAHTKQAAVAAPYTHTTAPLRRLVDRFVLVVCAALSAGAPVPAWARDALPELPPVMARSSQLAGQVDRKAIDTVEAAVLSTRIGEVFEGTVLSAGEGQGVIQLSDPAVTASCDGRLEVGTTIRARLTVASIRTATVRFVALP